MSAPDEREQVVDGVTYRFAAAWISGLETEGHWRLYWRQQKLMNGLVRAGDRALEIGLGSGFTANYLRSRRVDVTTLDIDADKHPDIVANIVTYVFAEPYDHVLAYEVFEHIPYEQCEQVIGRLAKIVRRYVFLSVPRNDLVPFRISLKLGSRRRERVFEWRRLEGRVRDIHHHWEVDHADTTRERFEQSLTTAGFTIERRMRHGQKLFYALGSPLREPRD